MYVVSPVLIYLSDVADYLKGIFVIAFLLSLIGFIVMVVAGLANILTNMRYGPNDHEYKKGLMELNISKKFIIPLAITSILVIVVPSKQTVYKMMVANLVTYENVDLTTETIEEAFDHAIDKLMELKGE